MEENKRSFHSLWHAFCYLPDAHFENQIEGERIVLMLRAHPITQLGWVINGFLLFALIVLLNIILGQYINTIQGIFINIAAIVFILAYYFFNYLSYFFNVGIVTDRRIIDVDFSSVLRKEITEARIDRIEDLTAKNTGYFPSIFNFGDVYIQTAGTNANIEFQQIPRPADVVRAINEIIYPFKHGSHK